MTLCLALSYGGREAIVAAACALARAVATGGCARGASTSGLIGSAPRHPRAAAGRSADPDLAASSGCRTSCSGRAPTPSFTSPRCCGPTSAGAIWRTRWPPSRNASAATAASSNEAPGPGVSASSRNARALASVSASSASGSESATMPPPTDSVEAVAAHQRGADGDRQIQIAGGAQPAGRAGVGAAAHRLELFDDLHRAPLGGAGDRAAGEGRAQQLRQADARGAAGRARWSPGGAPSAAPSRAPAPRRRSSRHGTRAPDRCARDRRSSRARRAPWPRRAARARSAVVARPRRRRAAASP